MEDPYDVLGVDRSTRYANAPRSAAVGGYELLRIGSGRETAKQSRKESAKRQTKSRATKKARAAAESVTVTDSAPKQPKAKQAKKDTTPPLSNWPSAAALAEITFEHCLRGLFQQIEGGLTVEQVIGKVADRARIAERVEEKLGDLPHQATVVQRLMRLTEAEAGGQGPNAVSSWGFRPDQAALERPADARSD